MNLSTCKLVALQKKLLQIRQFDDFRRNWTYTKSRQNSEKSGFIRGYWGEESWIEEQIKKDLNVTIRCIPQDQSDKEGICVLSGKKSKKQVIYAKAY